MAFDKEQHRRDAENRRQPGLKADNHQQRVVRTGLLSERLLTPEKQHQKNSPAAAMSTWKMVRWFSRSPTLDSRNEAALLS